MTWMWTDPDELIAAEAIQRRESGYPDRVFPPGASVEAVFAEWEETPQEPSWAYVEPSRWEDMPAAASPAGPGTPPSPIADLGDRLSGAWWGRCIGNCAGKPLEAGTAWSPDLLKEFLTASGNYPFHHYLSAQSVFPSGIPWVGDPAETAAETISAVPRDDDLDYTLVSLRVFEEYGHDLSTEAFAEAWVTLVPYLATCTAERVAYRNLVAGMPSESAADRHNPYREWVGALIRADAHGYLAPGRPAEAARTAWIDASLSHRANGVYGEVWAAALIAAAFTAESPSQAFAASLAVVPAKSRLGEELGHVWRGWSSGQDAEELVRAVHSRHPHMNPVHTINNAGIIAAAVLTSEGSFDQAIATAIAGCLDTDSNAATVGSVMGALVGLGRIRAEWRAPFHDQLSSAVMGFDRTGVQDVADRFIRLASPRNAG